MIVALRRNLFPVLVTTLTLLLAATAARAEDKRDAKFEWDQARRYLYVKLSFRDVVDEDIEEKMRRGLPTHIVLTATLYRVGSADPIATTAQTCKVTWHVWEEAFRIEIIQPGHSHAQWTTTTEGVLRRCTQLEHLLAGNSAQVPVGAAVYLRAKVQVNPVSPDLLARIKRWVSRPSGTGTAASGDALFSTFTGLFLQRIGDADRELKFTTRAVVPDVQKPPPKKQGGHP